MSTANRGKTAEAAVRKVLAAKASADFCWARWPDMHSGSRQPAPSDFITCWQGRLVLLEVKEVDSASRLPYKNFDTAQIARMRSWVMAGATAYALVYFSKSEEWFMASVNWFHENHRLEVNGKAVGSWDMANEKRWPKKELQKLLETYL